MVWFLLGFLLGWFVGVLVFVRGMLRASKKEFIDAYSSAWDRYNLKN